MTISGINGYQKEISFTIHPEIYNVEDGGVYDSGLVIDSQYNINIIIDSKPYVIGSSIEKAGNYELVVYGVNAYKFIMFYY